MERMNGKILRKLWQKKGGERMNCEANKSIECTVTSCANHCVGENYCALDHILVGTHEADPKDIRCTDCESFRKR